MKNTLLLLAFISVVGFGQQSVYTNSGGGVSSTQINAILDTFTINSTNKISTIASTGKDSVVTIDAGKVTNMPITNTNFGLSFTAYSAGTVYSLTNTAALLTFGTTSPSITLTEAGTYLILSGANYKLNGSTFAANQTITTKVRRTNNTAADLTGATDAITCPIVTTITTHAGTSRVPSVIYTTTKTTDILQVFGSVGTVPSAGTVDCTSAFIIAIKLF
jgi:hypothetical protein